MIRMLWYYNIVRLCYSTNKLGFIGVFAHGLLIANFYFLIKTDVLCDFLNYFLFICSFLSSFFPKKEERERYRHKCRQRKKKETGANIVRKTLA